MDVALRQRSRDLSIPTENDAKLPERSSLEGYEIDVLSFDAVMHLFKRPGGQRE